MEKLSSILFRLLFASNDKTQEGDKITQLKKWTKEQIDNYSNDKKSLKLKMDQIFQELHLLRKIKNKNKWNYSKRINDVSFLWKKYCKATTQTKNANPPQVMSVSTDKSTWVNCQVVVNLKEGAITWLIPSDHNQNPPMAKYLLLKTQPSTNLDVNVDWWSDHSEYEQSTMRKWCGLTINGIFHFRTLSLMEANSFAEQISKFNAFQIHWKKSTHADEYCLSLDPTTTTLGQAREKIQKEIEIKEKFSSGRTMFQYFELLPEQCQPRLRSEISLDVSLQSLYKQVNHYPQISVQWTMSYEMSALNAYCISPSKKEEEEEDKEEEKEDKEIEKTEKDKDKLILEQDMKQSDTPIVLSNYRSMSKRNEKNNESQSIFISI